ncbi:hypothetical protein PsorP6_008639 [Peronosclerospora sorghi]|uniref:Uncharacterized protein n=1 Tax=Peronosclerospora sorghi TaxID=230839 RepID=A0ACC0WD03_9STRA|nr:hypothetical protein PsorP6_008639 [Peronosclerospora sorghi]
MLSWLDEQFRKAQLAIETGKAKQTKSPEINELDEDQVPVGTPKALSFLLGSEEPSDNNEDFDDEPQAHEPFPSTSSQLDARGGRTRTLAAIAKEKQTLANFAAM